MRFERPLTTIALLAALASCSENEASRTDTHPQIEIEQVAKAIPVQETLPPPKEDPDEPVKIVSRESIELPAQRFERNTSAKIPGGNCGSRIALIGDSFTVNTYWIQLQRLCGRGTKVLDHDRNSETHQKSNGDDAYSAISRRTSQMLGYFDDMLKESPDRVVIFGGNNDILSASPNAHIITSNLEKMVEKAHRKNIKVVTVTLPPFRNAGYRSSKEYTSRGKNYGGVIVRNVLDVNTWLRSKSNPADAIADIYPALEDPNEKNAADRQLYHAQLRHPNRKGFQKIAETVYRALVSIEKRR